MFQSEIVVGREFFMKSKNYLAILLVSCCGLVGLPLEYKHANVTCLDGLNDDSINYSEDYLIT